MPVPRKETPPRETPPSETTARLRLPQRGPLRPAPKRLKAPWDRAKLSKKKAMQAAVVVLFVIAFGAAGALYHFRYGDRTTENFHAIQEKTRELIKVDVPDRLWPRFLVTRPDVMTAVLYSSRNDESCLAIMSCLPAWARERGNRPDRLLQDVLKQYLPQFDTERWTGTEEREIPVSGATERVKVASSLRIYDQKEVRVVSLDNLHTEHGVISLYYQSSVHSSVEDEIDRLLNSLR